MKFLIYTWLFLGFLISNNLKAQIEAPDKIETKKGEILIQPIIHGSLIIKWDNKTIYVDPYGGAESFKAQPKPDMILITDIHGDHLNHKTLKSLETSGTIMIVPQAVADKMDKEIKKHELIVLANGRSTKKLGISISAIPMYNLPESPDSRHTKGRGNGYILKIFNKKIYISGDTEDIKEMRSLKKIDLAFVCMNLPYTMNINQAASAVLEFKPKIVYPYHYRGKGGLSDVAEFKNLVNKENSEIEVRLKNWYPKK